MTTCCSSSSREENRISPPITVGSSRAFNVDVADEDGNAVNLTGARGYMTAVLRLGDVVPLITKRSTTAGGSDFEFLILDQTTYLGRGRFFITPEDTEKLDPSLVLKYDVWFVLSTGERKDVVQVSDMPLAPAATRFFPTV